MSKIKELRPNEPKNPYTIKDLDAELICMTMVRSLGEEYSHFASSLMLLKSLDKSELQAAFLAEEAQRRRRPEGPGSDAAMFSTSGTCKCGPTATCYFCEQPGHCTHKCHAYKQAKNNAKANAGRSGQGRRPRNANKASETPAASSTLPGTPTSSTTTLGTPTTSQNAQHTSQSAQSVTEFAGNASLCSFDPSHPLCPLQLDADADWNADTGATSHMTPHRHWLRNYAPKRVPIKLADNNIVYSAGVGTVVFSPVVDGKTVKRDEFPRVLHVPDLRNNLLSVLYHMLYLGFPKDNDSELMSFERPTGTPLFVASISASNAAFLDGSTVPLAEYASAATTVPLDIDLWHRRLAHHHLAGVRTLLDKKLVTGMKLDSTAAPDPICEPCLAGKMHSNPFPSSQWRASRPLELVHTDLHQVPYPSFSGCRYWWSFIDDYSRYRFILPIKAKSDVFEAFKQFKAYAENQSERKIKTLRDDKGGEYMSNAFLDFTTQCGIERQHTVRARPQQNGVTERANRVLSERLTTMLDESGLPKAFWGEGLAALVHVWNRCPTEAAKTTTPYELRNGRKPDVSHLGQETWP